MCCTDAETHKARKPHRCSSCGEAIAVGDAYSRWRCYDDGDAGTVKMHPECLDLHERDADCGEFTFGPFGHPRPAPATL